MMIVSDEICKSFNAHAHEYEQAAKVQFEIGQRMFSRLAYLKIKPLRVLDLGSGTGYFTKQLKAFYPKAEVIGFDLAFNMLKQAKSQQGWFNKWPQVNGDMLSMPFADGAFDLIFTNQVIHWASSVSAAFRELNRILAANGCLMFTTLGPDSFIELKQAWSTIDNHAHSNDFADMHDLGDWLLEERFLEPVVDMEKLTVQYGDFDKLIAGLKSQGVKNINKNRPTGLTGKRRWHQFEKNYTENFSQEGKFPLSYEVVYGHAWKGQQALTDKGSETFIPVSSIGRRK